MRGEKLTLHSHASPLPTCRRTRACRIQIIGESTLHLITRIRDTQPTDIHTRCAFRQRIDAIRAHGILARALRDLSVVPLERHKSRHLIEEDRAATRSSQIQRRRTPEVEVLCECAVLVLGVGFDGDAFAPGEAGEVGGGGGDAGEADDAEGFVLAGWC